MVQDTRIIVLSYFPPNQDYNTDEHDDIDDHDDKDLKDGKDDDDDHVDAIVVHSMTLSRI